MKKYSFIIFAIITIYFSLSLHAIACSCGEPPPLKEEFNSSSAVFIGKIIKGETIKINGNYSSRKYTVEVSKVIKGDIKDTVEIYTGIDGADCGYDFILGRIYIIYALNNGDENKLSVHLCSRTKEQGEIEPEEQLLFNKKSSNP
jgi:hypothetical protein